MSLALTVLEQHDFDLIIQSLLRNLAISAQKKFEFNVFIQSVGQISSHIYPELPLEQSCFEFVFKGIVPGHDSLIALPFNKSVENLQRFKNDDEIRALLTDYHSELIQLFEAFSTRSIMSYSQFIDFCDNLLYLRRENPNILNIIQMGQIFVSACTTPGSSTESPFINYHEFLSGKT